MRHRWLGLSLVTFALALVGCGNTNEQGAPPGVSGSSGASAGGGAGGSSPGAGASGSGGKLPDDAAVPPAEALSKLDLLLMIDNSRNMLEKQRLLLDALATLLDQLSGTGLQDIHVGVITSSLGSHGSLGP